jgi:glutathione S-transferase
MLDYRTLDEIIAHKGLRIVLVQGMPSPWGQAAKAIFEVKNLDYVVAPQEPGGANEKLEAWSGQSSGPVVAWADEKPIHRWIDILTLGERLAPEPSLVPKDAAQRALMIGLSNEICGELGIGWNRRLQMFAPAMESRSPPEGVVRMCKRYGYNRTDVDAAGSRTAESLRALAAQLKQQYAQGIHFFIGDALSALDLYWVAFANLLDPLPPNICPMPEAWRPAFVASDPAIKAALDPILFEHRDRVFKSCFKNPMEF